MTKEDKELLLRDLSSRLGYGTKMQVYYEDIGGCGYFDEEISSIDVESEYINDRWLDYIKPYLRPLSSMTGEEYEELKSVEPYYGLAPFEFIGDWGPNVEVLDWLNAHHFDYRGLIKKGLALKAPEDMYKINCIRV